MRPPSHWIIQLNAIIKCTTPGWALPSPGNLRHTHILGISEAKRLNKVTSIVLTWGLLYYGPFFQFAGHFVDWFKLRYHIWKYNQVEWEVFIDRIAGFAVARMIIMTCTYTWLLNHKFALLSHLIIQVGGVFQYDPKKTFWLITLTQSKTGQIVLKLVNVCSNKEGCDDSCINECCSSSSLAELLALSPVRFFLSFTCLRKLEF